MQTNDKFLRAASAKETGVHGYLGIPVIVAGRCAAVVEFFSFERQELDPVTEEITRFIAGQMARVIERDMNEKRRRALRNSFL